MAFYNLLKSHRISKQEKFYLIGVIKGTKNCPYIMNMKV